MRKLTASLLPLLMLGVQGCKKEPPPPTPAPTIATTTTTTQPAVVSVVSVTLGNAIDADKKIAKRVYGNAADWKKIFEANRDLLKDPDKIFPGQKLKIPAAD